MSAAQSWFKLKNILALVVGAVVLYLIVNTLVGNRLKDIELNTRVQVSNQETLLITIAETTARNGADAVTESIVKDCSVAERVEFETMLDALNSGLSHTKLAELERLFGRCGSFFADRKSVMVSRFSREIEVYQNYVDQLSVVTEEDQRVEFAIDNWEALASEERKQSDLFSGLVVLQDKIITALLSGSTPTSPEMVDILREVTENKEALVMASQQAAMIRVRLVSL